MKTNLTEEQTPPTPNDRPAVWDLVIEDMQARDRTGRTEYGTPLQPYNGRDALVDAYQEALDQCVYLRQAIEEREQGDEGLRRENERLRFMLEQVVRDGGAQIAIERGESTLVRGSEYGRQLREKAERLWGDENRDDGRRTTSRARVGTTGGAAGPVTEGAANADAQGCERNRPTSKKNTHTC